MCIYMYLYDIPMRVCFFDIAHIDIAWTDWDLQIDVDFSLDTYFLQEEKSHTDFVQSH